MKKLKNVDFPLAIAIMALLVIGCSRSLPFPKDCHTVKAKGIGQTVSQTATGATTVATITGDPLIAGTTEAEFSNIPSLDPNEAPFKGKLKLFTMHGTLTLRVYNGKLSPLLVYLAATVTLYMEPVSLRMQRAGCFYLGLLIQMMVASLKILQGSFA